MSDRARATSRLADWWPVIVLAPVLLVDAELSSAGHPLTAWTVLAAIAACTPLALRRHLPVVALVPLVTAGVVLALLGPHPQNTVVLIPMVGLYEIALRGDRRRSIWLALVSVPCVFVDVVPFASGSAHIAAIVGRNLLLCLLAIAAGDVLRARGESARRTAEAREQETLRRVADQRLAIAREIHDVVAHGMTAINVQAGVAAHLLERDPGQAHGALRDIKRTSGDALAELRSTLEILRDPGQTAPLTPPGCLADLQQLAAVTEAAGVTVALHTDGLGDLPDAVHHAGYRIVQEALTNVTRHSGARHARVSAVAAGGTLAIEVVDDGRATGATGVAVASGDDGVRAGNGLRGMRERAAALGGTLDAAAQAGGGFAVRARLPVSQPS